MPRETHSQPQSHPRSDPAPPPLRRKTRVATPPPPHAQVPHTHVPRTARRHTSPATRRLQPAPRRPPARTPSPLPSPWTPAGKTPRAPRDSAKRRPRAHRPGYACRASSAAIIERAEKQILLANHARELISLLDDTPIVPGEERVAFANTEAAREVLNDAEQSLKSWTPSVTPIVSSAAKIGTNAMPTGVEQQQAEQVALETAQERVEGTVQPAPAVPTHAAEPQTVSSPPYPVVGEERTEHMTAA
nr:putative sphingolipid long chain base-responsive protein pil1 [Quercus suber]